MRIGLSGFIVTLLASLGNAADVDLAERERRLDMTARAFQKAIENMVATCTKCAGHGRLRRERQLWTCPKCKGTGSQVVRLWHEKVHWAMRSQAYRDGAGKRLEVLLAHYEEMRRRARPLVVGVFKSVTLIDNTHGVSWHQDAAGTWTQFRWIHQPEHGWAWFHAKYDGAWPESDADFGYPDAKAADFIETRVDEKTKETRVETKALAVDGELTLRAELIPSASNTPSAVRLELTSKTAAARFSVNHSITIFADGKRVALSSVGYAKRKAKDGDAIETLTRQIARAWFVRLTNASRVEGQVGLACSFSLTSIHRRILAALLIEGDKPRK